MKIKQEKSLDSLINEEKELINELTQKQAELKLEETKKDDIDNDLYQLEYELSRLEIKKKYVENIPQTLKQEKKNIVFKELITFFVFALIIAGLSGIAALANLNVVVIPLLLTGLGIDAFGCTISGLIDFNEYKVQLEKYDLDQINQETTVVTKKIDTKQKEKEETQNNIKNLKEVILNLINSKESISSKFHDIKEVYMNLLNQYEEEKESQKTKVKK